MRAQYRLPQAILVAIILLAGPVTAAVEVHAAPQVTGNQVFISVTGVLASDAVTLTVDTGSPAITSPTGATTRMLESPALGKGWHTWVVVVTPTGGSATNYPGAVYVENSIGPLAISVDAQKSLLQSAFIKLDETATAIASLKGTNNSTINSLDALLDRLKIELAQLNATNQEQLAALALQQGESETKLTSLEGTSAATSLGVAELQGSQTEVASAANRAGTWGAIAGIAALAGAFLMLLASGFLWYQASSRHKEAMALLLAFAAKNGITHDSQELQIAFDALRGT